MVEITLTDENDEAPIIHVMLLQPPSGGEIRNILASVDVTNHPISVGAAAKFMGEYHTSITENPPPESIIAYVQVRQIVRKAESRQNYENQTKKYLLLTEWSSFGPGSALVHSSMDTGADADLCLDKWKHEIITITNNYILTRCHQENWVFADS